MGIRSRKIAVIALKGFAFARLTTRHAGGLICCYGCAMGNRPSPRKIARLTGLFMTTLMRIRSRKIAVIALQGFAFTCLTTRHAGGLICRYTVTVRQVASPRQRASSGVIRSAGAIGAGVIGWARFNDRPITAIGVALHDIAIYIAVDNAWDTDRTIRDACAGLTTLAVVADPTDLSADGIGAALEPRAILILGTVGAHLDAHAIVTGLVVAAATTALTTHRVRTALEPRAILILGAVGADLDADAVLTSSFTVMELDPLITACAALDKVVTVAAALVRSAGHSVTWRGI